MIYLTYEGVNLRDVEIRSFQQEIVRDESNTDTMYSRFIVSVSATLTDFDSSNDAGDGLTIAPVKQIYPTVARMNEVQLQLQKARGDFYFVVGGQAGQGARDELTLLRACGQLEREGYWAGVPADQMPNHPIDGTLGNVSRLSQIDHENGPHVSNVTIERIYGGKSMRVNATFKVCRLTCEPFTDTPPVDDPNLRSSSEVLSNRWAISETKDENWVSTVTLTGTLRTKQAEFFAQNYRLLVVPPLQRYYMRVEQSFVSDPTDTVLKYRIVDRQVRATPPPPAIKWSGNHTETTTKNGARQAAHVSLRLVGALGVDKRQLIAAAGAVLTKRIAGLQKQDDNPRNENYETILENLSISDSIADPVIEMSASVRYTSTDYKWLAQRVLTMQPDDPTYGIAGYDPTVAPVPLPYDSERPAGILRNYFHNPCSIWHGIGADELTGATSRPNNIDAYPPDAREYQELENLPEDNYQIEGETESRYNVYRFPYTFYSIRNRYDSGGGIMQLPYSEVAPGEDTALIAKVHAGIGRRVMTIEAGRDGKEPVIPRLRQSFTDANQIRYTLLDSILTPLAPELGPDGYTRRFQLMLELTYAMSRPHDGMTDILEVGSLPTDAAAPAFQAYDLGENTDYSNKITDTSGY